MVNNRRFLSPLDKLRRGSLNAGHTKQGLVLCASIFFYINVIFLQLLNVYIMNGDPNSVTKGLATSSTL